MSSKSLISSQKISSNPRMIRPIYKPISKPVTKPIQITPDELKRRQENTPLPFFVNPNLVTPGSLADDLTGGIFTDFEKKLPFVLVGGIAIAGIIVSMIAFLRD